MVRSGTRAATWMGGLAALALASVLSGAPALAGELEDRVRDLYRPYEIDDGQTPSAADVIRPMASGRLGRLLDREAACARRNGICNLGFDIIVNGQDYRIRDVRVAAAPGRAGRTAVTARFTNMGGRHETRYEFVQEAGGWKLDDVEARLPAKLRWRLSTLLSGPPASSSR